MELINTAVEHVHVCSCHAIVRGNRYIVIHNTYVQQQRGQYIYMDMYMYIDYIHV